MSEAASYFHTFLAPLRKAGWAWDEVLSELESHRWEGVTPTTPEETGTTLPAPPSGG